MDKQIKERKQEWENVCIESGKPHWKLKILVKTKYSNKVIMFEEMLEFKQTILLCCEKQRTLSLHKKSQRPKCEPLLKLSLPI
jgi:hypothetical protein